MPGVLKVLPMAFGSQAKVLAQPPEVLWEASAVFLFLPGDFAPITAGKGLMPSGNLFLSGGNYPVISGKGRVSRGEGVET